MDAFKKRLVIIGAGVGGMTTAAAMAHSGWDVTLLEKNARPGGKMGREDFDGCVFDTGPSLITMPFVFKNFFSSCGRDFDDYVSLRPLEPTCRYFWRDGTQFDAFTNGDDLLKEVRRVFPGDVAAVQSYLRDAEKAYEGTKDIFLFNRFEGFKEFLKLRNLRLLPFVRFLRPHKTLHSLHKNIFKNPKLIQLFDRFATYNGSSPYLAPATLSVIAHVELGLGAWYPDGGIYSIAQAFEKLCRETGVNVRCDSEVKSILTNGKTATGVELTNGDVLKADAVVSNVDVDWTRQKFLKKEKTARREYSSSGFVVLAVVRKRDRGLSHHNILFSDNYEREFDDIFKKKIPADDMTVYISNSSHTDPGMAQAGLENWFILINAPSGMENYWDEHKESYWEKIVQKMSDFGLDIREDIISYRIITPDDFKNRYSATDGSLYGAASNSPLSAFLRPGNVSGDVKNLFYVGGSTHPGGGVPLVVLSGGIVAKIMRETF